MRLKDQANLSAAKNHSSDSSRYNIILIDDEYSLIKQLANLLENNGHNTGVFSDPLEGIDAIRNGNYDLLVLDYLMEPIHGSEVVKRIREFNKEIYILLLTGFKGLGAPIQTIREYDIQGYCEKGVNFDDALLSIESGLKSIEQRRTIKLFKDGLNSILNSVHKMYSMIPLNEIIEGMLNDLISLADCQDAFILVDDNNSYGLRDKNVILRGVGKYKLETDNFSDSLEPIVFEAIGQTRTNKVVTKIDTGMVLPLVNETSQILGVVYIEGKNFLNKMQLIEIFVSQAASAINSAFLHNLINIQNEMLNESYNELRTHYLDTIQSLRRSIDAKDTYTRGHSDRVSYYATCIAKAFNLSEEEIKAVSEAGIFHDVGKIGTNDAILKKNSRLDNDEYNIIKEHPKRGAYILSAVSMFKDVVPLVRSHHERYDGRGYPDGLKGEEIPFLARILSVADAFDAMTSDRQYRSSIGFERAIEQLKIGRGTQFDANIVDKFLETLEDFEKMSQEVAATFQEIEE